MRRARDRAAPPAPRAHRAPVQSPVPPQGAREDALRLPRLAGNRALVRAVHRPLPPGGRVPVEAATLGGAARGGQPLPAAHRRRFEAAFGHPLGDVRVHRSRSSAEATQALGARALAVGRDILVAPGAPSPDTGEGDRLLAHEVAHVVQQTAGGAARVPGSVSRPGDRGEVAAWRAADLALDGRAADPGVTTAAVQGDWLEDLSQAAGGAVDWVSGTAAAAGEGLADLVDAREHEDYLDALEDLRDFTDEVHEVEDYQSPNTQIGGFDAAYQPATGQLAITVRCRFAFHDGAPAEFPSASGTDLRWQPGEREDYQERWLAHTTGTWSGKHTFHCCRDWWERLTATVTVAFVAVEDSPHFNLDVTKIPPGEFRTSSVRAPTSGLLETSAGSGSFDSEDLKAVSKGAGAGQTQTPAGHEAGHMLGLDDEYATSPGGVSHSDVCDHEFGHGVAKADDGRIMSAGDRVDPEHGVTFLTALQEASDEDWSPSPKPPKPVPVGAPPHPLGNSPGPP